jgi:hypothetical protein
MKNLSKFILATVLWFCMGYCIMGMSDVIFSKGCPFDAGGNNMEVPGTATFDGAVYLDASEWLYWTGDGNTYIAHAADQIIFHLGGTNRVDVNTTELNCDVNVDVNGSLLLDVTTVNLAALGTNTVYVLTATESGYIIVDTSSPCTIELPAVSGLAGTKFTIVKDSFTFQADVQAVTLDGNGAETINGAATNANMNNWYDTITVVCDGDEWFIIDSIFN